jgi:uncharacterized protein with FMN-binding domain
VSKTGAYTTGSDPFGDAAQVTVTKTNGVVTGVSMAQAKASQQWLSAYDQLVALAIRSKGANVGNLTGATYCSRVFNNALASAMSKF